MQRNKKDRKVTITLLDSNQPLNPPGAWKTRKRQSIIGPKAKGAPAGVEPRPSRVRKANSVAAGLTHSAKRRSTDVSQAGTRSADVEPRPMQRRKANIVSARLENSKCRSKMAAKASLMSADVEPGPLARRTARSEAAGLTLSRKRRSNVSAQSIPAAADASSVQSCRDQPRKNRPGSPIRKRRSTAGSKALPAAADASSVHHTVETPSIGRPSSPIRKRRSAPFAKAKSKPADVEPCPNGNRKAGTPTAGLTLSSKRRSILDAKATNRSADVDDARFIDPGVVAIREQWRRRQSWHRSEKALTLAASAWCRSHVHTHDAVSEPKLIKMSEKGFTVLTKSGLKRAADLMTRLESNSPKEDEQDVYLTVLPFFAARAPLEAERTKIEKDLAKLGRRLPIAHVIKQVPGISANTLAAIVGEAGDLSVYRSIRGLWKRMGLAVIAGERQRKCIDKDAAEAHAYNPSRRSVMWNVGNGLISHMGLGPRPLVGEDFDRRNSASHWQKLFVRELRKMVARDPEHSREPTKNKDGKPTESFSKHAAAHAKRLVEKAFLKWLWQEWKKV